MKTIIIRNQSFEVSDEFNSFTKTVVVQLARSSGFRSYQDMMQLILPLQTKWSIKELAALVTAFYPESKILRDEETMYNRLSTDVRRYNQGKLPGMVAVPEQIALTDARLMKKSVSDGADVLES